MGCIFYFKPEQYFSSDIVPNVISYNTRPWYIWYMISQWSNNTNNVMMITIIMTLMIIMLIILQMVLVILLLLIITTIITTITTMIIIVEYLLYCVSLSWYPLWCPLWVNHKCDMKRIVITKHRDRTRACWRYLTLEWGSHISLAESKPRKTYQTGPDMAGMTTSYFKQSYCKIIYYVYCKRRRN